MADQQRMMKIAQAAMKGDEDAAARIIAEAMPLVRGRYESLNQRVDYLEANEWEREQTRRQVMEEMDGTVPKDMTIGALSDIHQSLIKLLSLTPAALLAEDDEESQAFGEMWTETVTELVVKLHNPTIRYAIIGGFHPDRQEEVEDYLDRMGRELWGVVDVLSQTGNVHANDFPPEVRGLLNAYVEWAESKQTERPAVGD